MDFIINIILYIGWGRFFYIEKICHPCKSRNGVPLIKSRCRAIGYPWVEQTVGSLRRFQEKIYMYGIKRKDYAIVVSLLK